VHSACLLDLISILFFVWYDLAFFVPNWIWRENIPLNTSKPNSDLTEQLVRSTYVSPQLEANSIIPVRQIAVSVRVEPPPCVEIAGLAIIAEFYQKPIHPI
jgi:hypothetical protein